MLAGTHCVKKEGGGPEESETAAPSDPPEEDPNCEPRPAWWTEEARIIRQQGTVSGPGCENATSNATSNAEVNAEVTATIGATALTGAFGFGGSWVTAWAICETAVAFEATDSECKNGPLALGIFGGIAWGFMGYTNQPFPIMFSSSVPLLFAGGMLGGVAEAPESIGLSMGLLGGVGGAYLGYRLWRVRQPTGPLNLFKTPKSIWSRTSVSPYLNRERSGLVLSGRF